MGDVSRQDEGNLGPLMLALSWTLAAIAIIIVILRVLVRLKRIHGLRLDDHVMLLSLVSQCYSPSDNGVMLIASQGLWGDQHGSYQHCSFLGFRKAPRHP